MARISLHRTHRMTPAKARSVAGEVAERLKAEYDLVSAWQGNTLQFSRPGVTGTLKLARRAIDVDIELGLALGLFRATIEAHVREHLEELCGPP